MVRHFTHLSQRNVGIDDTFYPLGSCTMKYNPKVAERVAAIPGFANLHPHQSSSPAYANSVQGAYALVHDIERLLAEIAGMKAASLQPIAGAHGELTGTLLIAAYHRDHGNTHKDTILIPDSAHGTNPASAAMAGFKVTEIPSNERGVTDFARFEAALGDHVAGIMLTCPNTHGLFEPEVHRIAEAAHAVDALLYYDGANLNAIVGQCRPGDLGFDVMHYNLHKTFATPHGGGGPGAGPVGVRDHLVPFLPVSIVVKRADGTYALEYDRPKSIGYVAPFYGNFGIVLRAYVYILLLGKKGLAHVAENAVLNANYIRCKLKDHYAPAFDALCKHECVFSTTEKMASNGVHAIDIAKALIDRGFHPPTVYFPTIVKEAMMIEPTETESKETLDAFIAAMIEIAECAETDPEQLKAAPVTTPVSRPNETAAAKNLNIAYLD